MTFQPYTHKQLQTIVMTRMTGIDAFDGDAVQLAARKVMLNNRLTAEAYLDDVIKLCWLKLN